MKKFKILTKFQMGFIVSAIWTPFLNHRDIFSSNSIVNCLIVNLIGVMMILVGGWFADKMCDK